MSDYADFLASKAVRAQMHGLAEVPELAAHLFPFQRLSVAHNLMAGRAGLFLDTGLGKTECQLEWCRHAMGATNGRALILTPLAVAQQTKRRADRWGHEARVIRDQSEAGDGINICNYDRLDRLDPAFFGAVSLDEGSILKSFNGKTRAALTTAFGSTPFRLVATATPAPNDHMELGQYADYLGIMASNEMLSRWFINDASTASQEWRLKHHAAADFWDWIASWARMAERPSDLGDDETDAQFVLPPYFLTNYKSSNVEIVNLTDGLFADTVMSATSMHDVKRQTSKARAETAAEIVAREPDEPHILWCDTDYEADALKAACKTAKEIRGSMHIDLKEELIEGFATGSIKHLIGKPSMLGFGLDWSHCARMTFVGRSFSYEKFYQALRRCWRFGQKRELQVNIIVAEGEDTIARAIARKADAHTSMKSAMRAAMSRANGRSSAVKVAYDPKYNGRLPAWL